jgi:curved DNA-binding protein CbpA
MGPKIDALGPFELLDLSPTDDIERIRDAYHRIASQRHPDLFRGKLGAAESEQLMRMFARVTGAYAQLRDPETRKKFGARPRATPPGGSAPAATPTGLRKISPRALSHVRRAEALLKTGDVASAILHLRMAVAAEPNVKELRQMLSETEAQLKK